VIVGQPALHELLGRIAFWNRPLSGTVEGESLRGRLNTISDDPDGFLPGDFPIAVSVTKQRFGQSIFAIKCCTNMIAFDAQQALIDVSIAVAGNGDNFALLHADLHMASRTAKAAGSLLPVNSRSLVHRQGSVTQSWFLRQWRLRQPLRKL
jgi:hypothetical protein